MESLKPLYLCLFGDLQRIVNFNSEVVTRNLTKSHDRSLLSMARLKSASSRAMADLQRE
jgi:hypothetical protein